MFMSITSVNWDPLVLLHIPAVLAAASGVIMILHEIHAVKRPPETLPTPDIMSNAHAANTDSQDGPKHYSIQAWIEKHDGLSLCIHKVIQLAGVSSLLTINAVELIQGHYKLGNNQSATKFSLLAVYIYFMILSLTSLLALRGSFRDSASRHLDLILFITFLVYLANYILPLSLVDGPATHIGIQFPSPFETTWLSISTLFIVGFIIPAFKPRAFRASFPGETPRLDATASFFSRHCVSFADKIIYDGNRLPDLKVSDLPELGHPDRSAVLHEKACPRIDPLHTKKTGHVFFQLAWYFSGEVVKLLFWISMHAITLLIAPYALKSLLGQLDGEFVSAYQPWLWCLLLALGPVITTVCHQNFIYYLIRTNVQQESIITQMVFDHALRMRLDQDATNRNVKDVQVDSDGTKKDASKKQDGNSQLMGRINNLITSDLAIMMDAPFALTIPGSLVHICVAMYFLYGLLGWSAFVGFGAIIICIPLPTFVAKLTIKTQKRQMEMTDKRVQVVTETIGVLRMIKLFAWSNQMLSRIFARRDEELKYITRTKMLSLVMYEFQIFLPALATIATVATYTIGMKGAFTPARAFTSLAVFDLVRAQLSFLTYYGPAALRAKVSYDRLNEFLHSGNIMGIAQDAPQSPEGANDLAATIGFNAASFSWHGQTQSTEPRKIASSERNFCLKCEGKVQFKEGVINIIIGPTGSGKTSVLMALLGEMHYKPDNANSWVNLPRNAGVAYVAQESWVLNDTIRNNILFGEAFDQEKYNKVIRQCGLERDIALWQAGDQTEVGEKGLTLSGGQKARVTLARALYSPAKILLIDDVLASLDVHTAKHIVDEAFRGELIADRTVLLVTHNLALVSPIAQHVLLLTNDGRIGAQGTVAEVLKLDSKFVEEVKKEDAILEKAEDELESPIKPDSDETASKGKLIVAEEKAMGRISADAILLFLRGLGGVRIWIVITLLHSIKAGWDMAEYWFLGYWSGKYEGQPTSQVPAGLYVGIYAAILMAQLLFIYAEYIVYYLSTIRASRVIHTKLMTSIFGATLRWLDTVPAGRIITRCTQDIQTVDTVLASWAFDFFAVSFHMIILYITSVYSTGWVALLSGAMVAGLGGWLGIMYLRAQLGIRREMSNAKSPILSQISTALTSLASIRAYGAQAAFKSELARRIDVEVRCASSFHNLNRWIGVRSEALGGFFAGTVAAALVYGRGAGAPGVGFTLSVVAAFSRRILSWIRLYNAIEIQANSLERILDFIRVEQEPKPVEILNPPAYWPSSGDLIVEGLSARYSQDSPEVLQNVSFHAKSGERIGVVGRTGAGKSTLGLALLRAIKVSGKVYLDGRATDEVNLDGLRSRITVIPQHPELMQGTIRDNLDPFGQFDDGALNNALRSAGLFNLQGGDNLNIEADAPGDGAAGEANAGHKITVDSEVRGNGSNFSAGQRQIIALARALLRRTKLLILDEATAGIDYLTDTMIQKTLRSEVDKDTTVITIAHRLQTVMDSDKIMVLDAGRLVEFDSPRNLLKKGGLFKSLVEESNDAEDLKRLVDSSSRDNGG